LFITTLAFFTVSEYNCTAVGGVILSHHYLAV